MNESIGEQEHLEARSKAKAVIVRTLSGRGSFDDVYDDIGHVGDGGSMDDVFDPFSTGPRNLGELPPETAPSEDLSNPFPMLERPLGG